MGAVCDGGSIGENVDADLQKRLKQFETTMGSKKFSDTTDADIEVLADMTCLGNQEIKRLKKNFLDSHHQIEMGKGKALMAEDNIAVFWHLDKSVYQENITRLYRAFRMYDISEKDDGGFSFPHFILVIDSIIGFNHPRIRLTFTRRFFDMSEDRKTISTEDLKKAYDSAKIFASADHFFTPLEFASDRQNKFEMKELNKEEQRRHSEKLVDETSLKVILQKRTDLWTFLLPDESHSSPDFSE